MITIDEIRSVAAQVSLSNIVVEKDYALGWLLWGLHHHPISGTEWVFKGGTCLKKCYFNTYRFSEDLDFSCKEAKPPTVEFLSKILSEVSDYILEESGIEFPKSSIQFEIVKNRRETISIQGGIKYRGPVRPQVSVAQMQRIKIDLTLDEPIILLPIIRNVEHNYSDRPVHGISTLSYAYEEIFAEKVRALIQRLRARDLYDVIHLYQRMDLNPNRTLVYSTLKKKCNIRGLDMPTINTIENHVNRALLESEWENQLRHQVSALPPVQDFLAELPQVIDWINRKTAAK